MCLKIFLCTEKIAGIIAKLVYLLHSLQWHFAPSDCNQLGPIRGKIRRSFLP